MLSIQPVMEDFAVRIKVIEDFICVEGKRSREHNYLVPVADRGQERLHVRTWYYCNLSIYNLDISLSMAANKHELTNFIVIPAGCCLSQQVVVLVYFLRCSNIAVIK